VRLKTLRLKTMSVVPLVAVGVLAAGTTVVMANPGHSRSAVRAPVAAAAAVVDQAAAATVVDLTTLPVADPAIVPLVDPTTALVGASAQSPVNLGTAGTFAVLSKSGITNVYASAITGNVGASPITGAAIGLTCPEVTGTIYSVDAAGPLPCVVKDATGLTTAVSDEETAYNDAAGRTTPDFVNLGAGEIGGLTLAPGLYSWSTGVSISNDVTLAGGPNDVWIFQIAGTLNEASAKNVTLTGGAQAKNVFWQSAGSAAIGTTAHFEGTILSKTMIAMKTGASANGRLLAQTAVTLQMNAVTMPVDVVTPVVDVTTPPVDVTTPPVDVTTPPVDVTTPPVDVTTPPVDVTTPPVDVTTPPVDVTTPPVDVTTPPAGVVTPPAL
jgi:Ice-binding-like